jgi:murein DD-endopeptidase MepM/ murein hydrolase activator NlpD
MQALAAALAVVVLAVMSALPTAARPRTDYDDAIREAERQAAAAETQRAELAAALTETADRLSLATLELLTVQARLPMAQVELEIAESVVAEARADADDLAERLQAAENLQEEVEADPAETSEEAVQARAQVAQMARSAIRTGAGPTTLGLAIGADSPEEFRMNLALSSSAARVQTRTLSSLRDSEAVAAGQVVRLAAVSETIEDLSIAAEDAVVVAEEAEAEAAERLAEVEGLISRQASLQAEIQLEHDLIEEDIAAIEAEQAQIQGQIQALVGARDAEIERLRLEEEERRRQQSGGSGSDGSYLTPSPGVVFLDWPTHSRVITSPFGVRNHPVLGVPTMHTGIDLRAPCGVPIFAAGDGIVVVSAYWTLAGNVIIVDHGSHNGQNIMTLYSHMMDRPMRVGDWVSRGQQIARSGTTGRSTGCHLHFEVHVNGNPVNPVPWLP